MYFYFGELFPVNLRKITDEKLTHSLFFDVHVYVHGCSALYD